MTFGSAMVRLPMTTTRPHALTTLTQKYMVSSMDTFSHHDDELDCAPDVDTDVISEFEFQALQASEVPFTSLFAPSQLYTCDSLFPVPLDPVTQPWETDILRYIASIDDSSLRDASTP